MLPMQHKSTLLPRGHTQTAKYQVNGLHSFIKSSLEYMRLVIKKNDAQMDLKLLYVHMYL